MNTLPGAQSLLQRTFPPLIGALTSQSVEQICKANNLSFTELLRPFCNVYVDAKLKDPSGNDLVIKHLKVGIVDAQPEVPPPLEKVKRLLSEAVGGAWCEVTKEAVAGNYILDVPIECPWFYAWTETFLQVQFPSEHEFLRHLLGCMLVTSTQDPPETLQVLLEKLKQLQVPSPSRSIKWFCPAIFKFYIVLHDSRTGDKAAGVKFFESIRTAYGADHCYFLELNSRQPGENAVLNLWVDIKAKTPEEESPAKAFETGKNSLTPDHPLSPMMENNSDVHDGYRIVDNEEVIRTECGVLLSSRDIDYLRELMVLMVRNALLPHVEKQIYILNDLVANKKGVSRSLLSATKRLFGSPRPGTGSPGSANSQLFPPDAPELQIRRLGDLYFLFSSYANAFQAYYTAKRELGMEQAWLYYAGALEMAALSAFMLSEPWKKAVEYIEEAITTYQTSCQLPQFATRATLLSYECLKEKGMYAEAAKQLIRMTSEDSDLRSALLLEQAAYCVLRSANPRKYAWHMVLAGNRFTKAGQRKHALRCARQAMQVYDGRGWSLIEDHINSTIGRLTSQLHASSNSDSRLLEEGLQALGKLLHSKGRQMATQQAAYLLDYLNMYQTYQKETDESELAVLPLPLSEDNSASVRVTANQTDPKSFQTDTADKIQFWGKMEEILLTETIGAPMVFRPSLTVLSKNSTNPVGHTMAVSERLDVQIGLRNPLQISLPVTQLRLLWRWNDGIIDETKAVTETLPSLLIPPLAVNYVTLSVQPGSPGFLEVYGVGFSLTTAAVGGEQVAPVIRGRVDLKVRGPKLRPAKEDPFAEHYADDRRLCATVVPSAPMLTVSSSVTSLDMVCGQMERLSLELCNTGNMAVTSLHAITNAVGLVHLPQSLVLSSKIVRDTEQEYQVVTLRLPNSLPPGDKLSLPLCIRAPATRGPSFVNVMFLYTGTPEGSIKHRVARFTLRLTVSGGIEMRAVASRSHLTGADAINLCLSAVNQHSGALAISEIILASRYWSLKSPPLCPLGPILEPCESLHLVARAGKRREVDKSIVTSLPLGETLEDLNDSVSNLLLRRADDQLMVLGLLWQSSEGARRGLTMVGIEKMGEEVSSAPKVSAAGIADPYASRALVIFGPDRVIPTAVGDSTLDVTLNLSYPDLVECNFSANRLCSVDVTLEISNSNDREVIVEINPLRPSQDYFAFEWAGRARARLKVSSKSHATLALRAVMSQPGTYDLAARVSAAVVTSCDVRPLPVLPESPLIVVDKGNS